MLNHRPVGSNCSHSHVTEHEKLRDVWLDTEPSCYCGVKQFRVHWSGNWFAFSEAHLKLLCEKPNENDWFAPLCVWEACSASGFQRDREQEARSLAASQMHPVPLKNLNRSAHTATYLPKRSWRLINTCDPLPRRTPEWDFKSCAKPHVSCCVGMARRGRRGGRILFQDKVAFFSPSICFQTEPHFSCMEQRILLLWRCSMQSRYIIKLYTLFFTPPDPWGSP